MLDTSPGEASANSGDHPADVIAFVRRLALPVGSRTALTAALVGAGFTPEGAAWMGTNLAPSPGGGLRWVFDIEGVAHLYASYLATDLWPLVEHPPLGARIDFVRAQRSAFEWSDGDCARIARAGARVHFLARATRGRALPPTPHAHSWSLTHSRPLAPSLPRLSSAG